MTIWTIGRPVLQIPSYLYLECSLWSIQIEVKRVYFKIDRVCGLYTNILKQILFWFINIHHKLILFAFSGWELIQTVLWKKKFIMNILEIFIISLVLQTYIHADPSQSGRVTFRHGEPNCPFPCGTGALCQEDSNGKATCRLFFSNSWI